MITEETNPRSQDIDRLATADILRIINEEDQGVALAVQKVIPEITRAVDLVVERMQRGGRLFYIGAGTSGRLGVLDASECIPTFNTHPDQVQGIIAGGQAALTRALEGAEDNRKAAVHDLQAVSLTQDDTVIGIAASGRTPYVLSGLEYASDLGAGTVFITCNHPVGDTHSNVVIAAIVGPEVITGSTRMKAGTAQKMILNMISTTTMIKLGKVYGNLMVDVQPRNQKLHERAVRLVTTIAETDEANARHLLELASYEVKTAVVMSKHQISAEDARQRLQQANGILRRVL